MGLRCASASIRRPSPASVHGQHRAKGDHNVATCARAANGRARHPSRERREVAGLPTNVANTCATCHADTARMHGYKRPDGSPLPTQQFADFQKSVHYATLTKGHDLAAPTCNDCHGNHGAAPPGVGSVANVCGTCHAVFAQKFATSVHKDIFDKGCVECHSNHAVLKPSDDMLAATGHGICATCHNADDKADKGAAAAVAMRSDIERLKTGIERTGALIGQIKKAGIEVSDQQAAARGRHEADARPHRDARFAPPQVAAVVQRGTRSSRRSTRPGRTASSSSVIDDAGSSSRSARFSSWSSRLA
jgi:predicted CXXCH cytochrome family protein